jgi:hypothetical protein
MLDLVEVDTRTCDESWSRGTNGFQGCETYIHFTMISVVSF